MKKPKTSQFPSAASLRDMPEIDFARYRVRRNPYSSRIAREGLHVVHDEPSTESLAEMPEADFTRARVRGNPYASRAAETTLQYGRGRPKRGDEVGPTHTRSLRLPAKMWKALDSEARARHTTSHGLLRELISRFLTRPDRP